MRAVPLTLGQILVDLDTPLSAANCTALLSLDRPSPRIAGVIRYLGDVSQAEAAIILDAGLLLGLVQHPRTSTLTAMMGQLDGTHAVSSAHALGVPDGVALWCDLESWAGDAVSYVNEWSSAVADAGFIAGLYVGWSANPLTGAELAGLKCTAYWRSCSEVPEPAGIGWQMMQLFPGDQASGSILVDYDVVCSDWKGRFPVFVGP